MNAFHLVYLSGASQLKLGCFKVGLPSLGPAVFGTLCAYVLAIVWITILVASATAFMIASLIIYSAIFGLCFLTYDLLLLLYFLTPDTI